MMDAATARGPAVLRDGESDALQISVGRGVRSTKTDLRNDHASRRGATHGCDRPYGRAAAIAETWQLFADTAEKPNDLEATSMTNRRDCHRGREAHAHTEHHAGSGNRQRIAYARAFE